MLAPPDPEMRNPATLASGRASSQGKRNLNNVESIQASADLQARQLRRLFSFEGAETDLPEDFARELFEAVTSHGRLHLVVRGAA